MLVRTTPLLRTSLKSAISREAHPTAPERIIWGSFERNNGSWTPYSSAENEAIEAAFQQGLPRIALPTCFNAVVHFIGSKGDAHHHQTTPAIMGKPPGFRSVIRGVPGQAVPLYWWGKLEMWRLDEPLVVEHRKEVVIELPGPCDEVVDMWQWCDLNSSEGIEHAVEANWHPYTWEQCEAIERAWFRGESLMLTIGRSEYVIGRWQGRYGTQENLETGSTRHVRCGRVSTQHVQLDPPNASPTRATGA